MTAGEGPAPEHPRVRRVRNPRGQGERLRDDLVASATRLLARDPTKSTLSLRAVAREAGVSTPSVYLHFADKDELLTAVVETQLGAFGATINHAARAAADPAGALRAACLAYCRYAVEQPGLYRVMFDVPPDTVVPRDVKDLPGAAVFGDLVQAIARCAAAGYPQRHDPMRAGVLVWVGLHGIVTLRVGKPAFPWPPLEELVDDLLADHCGLPTTR